ncbi:hypothetical protein JR316_0000609 [Psilocybe cubensis]|uniref:Uncharacterized protein n=2 Tax=Psilocybe cubensis TaxID=181762 RepID=A0ACB8HHA3_PSICU|nr:hypothetical protein JR316_0000609 [Psilocybe cubensis]KAH9486544.1 hypothetical protein JR316_0000609 [Psilocybe cubensis]
MSFQHFRLGELPLHQPLQQQSTQQPPPTITPAKQPYGSGDSDDGYTLVFPNLAAFQDWRAAEEERHCVEFVKGDTHGSKADPPRFKDHTKLVCARHSRSGRKKYVKKHPDRVRKVPSRKLEGQGCQASISYKTYFDTEEVRACYISAHSHEIGPANLPFTRRGRKAAVQSEKERGRNKSVAASEQQQQQQPSQQVASSSSSAMIPHQSTHLHQQQQQQQQQQPVPGVSFNSAVSMLAPLPGQPFTPQPAQPYNFASAVTPFGLQNQQPVPNQGQSLPQERWDNMATLFQTIRDHARAFEYPVASTAALESILIRLYLESPMGISPQHTMSHVLNLSRNQGPTSAQIQPTPSAHQSMNGNINDGPNASSAGDAS